MVKGGGQLGDKGEKAVLLAVTEFYTRPLRRGAHAEKDRQDSNPSCVSSTSDSASLRLGVLICKVGI